MVTLDFDPKLQRTVNGNSLSRLTRNALCVASVGGALLDRSACPVGNEVTSNQDNLILVMILGDSSNRQLGTPACLFVFVFRSRYDKGDAWRIKTVVRRCTQRDKQKT